MNESDLTIPESLNKSAKNMQRLQQYHAMMRSAVTDGSRTPPYFTPEQMRRACELLRKEILRDLQRMMKMSDSYDALAKAIDNRNQAIALEQQALEMSENI